MTTDLSYSVVLSVMFCSTGQYGHLCYSVLFSVIFHSTDDHRDLCKHYSAEQVTGHHSFFCFF